MSITTVELTRDAPFGLYARFAEDVDGKTWFHLVSVAGMSLAGEALIVGGKGPRRNNYRIVPVTIYSNYRGLASWDTGGPAGRGDDFGGGPGASPYVQSPARNLVEVDGALVVRFSISQVAAWLDGVLKAYAKHGDLDDDDEARIWTRKMAPFCTLTDDDLASLDGALPQDSDSTP
jgi:hypothetical protein